MSQYEFRNRRNPQFYKKKTVNAQSSWFNPSASHQIILYHIILSSSLLLNYFELIKGRARRNIYAVYLFPMSNAASRKMVFMNGKLYASSKFSYHSIFEGGNRNIVPVLFMNISDACESMTFEEACKKYFIYFISHPKFYNESKLIYRHVSFTWF